MKRKLKLQKLENRLMMTMDDGMPDGPPPLPSPPPDYDWHNEDLPTDVNDDGETTAIDALIIINELNNRLVSDPITFEASSDPNLVSRSCKNHYDVNDDFYITAIDALMVINQLGRDYIDSVGEQINLDFLDEE